MEPPPRRPQRIHDPNMQQRTSLAYAGQRREKWEAAGAGGGSGEGAGPPELVRVRREVLAACMTCPICDKLLRDATTISECLHTFCRKCIFEKLTDEEVDCCPICNIDLGCVPVEKLRPDHNLQDVRSKIFPLKRRKVNAPEVPSITLPIRRKERSLSSLVVNTPRVATKIGLTGRRTKTAARRRASALRGLGPVIDEPSKKAVNQVEDCTENSSSSETLSKIAQNRRQNSSTSQPSNHAPDKSTENGNECFKDKSELWQPLNCLLEVANRTKNVKSSSQSSINKEEQSNGPDSEVLMHKTKARIHLHTSKMQDEKDGVIPQSPVLVKAKRFHPRKKKDLKPSAQALIDAAAATRDKRNSPIWLSLLPTMDQNKDTTVPQTRSCYLRFKDGNLPVSFIQKYLVKKLDLPSETEVEIACRSQVVNSALTLNNLADLWMQSESPLRVRATLGNSAKDFVMVLNYRCKAPTP
ncbi:E3 ubiquitin protein ligase DRIP2-like [Iris pallida]|uniref:E3 ubiquitin protein ligase DRIP2-like n=1 Tax=Iris pallida TaxID=29817 RepID=A0AAX6DZD1_IRIPA|nr:E3 ubiquitin protein ligase DRIP2-like [Iris pallida]